MSGVEDEYVFRRQEKVLALDLLDAEIAKELLEYREERSRYIGTASLSEETTLGQ